MSGRIIKPSRFRHRGLAYARRTERQLTEDKPEAEEIRETRAGARKDLRHLLDDYERRLILTALDAADGHQRRAAASLGLQPSTLSQKMKRLGVRRRVQVAWPGREDDEQTNSG